MPARQGTRQRKTAGLDLLQHARGRKCVWKLLNTHRSLSVHAGHVDDGAFGLDQVGHAEMCQVVHAPGAVETKGSYQLHLLGMTRSVNLGQRVLCCDFGFLRFFTTVRAAMWTSPALFMSLLEFYINVLCVCSTIRQNQFTKLSRTRFYRPKP